MTCSRFSQRVFSLAVVVLSMCGSVKAATLTVTTIPLGPTPDILAYNSGHFYPGSNTRDWWRYAGVNGVRMFISPSEIEPADDLAPAGDGVTNAASFLVRKAALRADPLNPAFINWGGSTVFSNRYESNDLYPNNHIRVNYALGELRKLGVQVCAQITASQSRFPIADTSDWPNMWELWQHYYAQAFYLGRVFDVERYQMYNEPNHSNANGLTITNHLLRLQLVSDAVQSAIADVNRLYGKTLSPKLLAPVTAGSADGSYPGWGESVVTNRHLNFLGQTDTNFSLIQVYDYHQYNSSPTTFGSDLANLHGLLTADMSPEARYRSAISEFNTRTGATYDGIPETLDTPAEYSRFGAIVVNLLANSCAELYCFKFSQTLRDAPTTYPVQKNAMHYVDNSNAPYNVGGITRAGEVWRLVNKAFAPGRNRLNTIKGAGATSLDTHSSQDPVNQRFYLFSVNSTPSGVDLDLDLSAWNLPAGSQVLIEEVSEFRYGAGVIWTQVPAGRVLRATQGPNSVWLLSASARVQALEQVLPASGDAQVRDGANRNLNYGGDSAMLARNDPANAANRSVAFMQFQLPPMARSNLQFAILSFQASAAATNTLAQAQVYGLDTNGWAEGTVTWSTGPNLKDNVAAGATINRGVVEDAGGTAHVLGQVVVASTNLAEQFIDVTEFIRKGANPVVSFLVAQEPRWDVALPSLAAGDVQADGVRIVTKESGQPPRLRIVLGGSTTNLPPSSSYWTNVAAATEAFVRGGASANTDQDEAALGYLMVKYDPLPFDFSRKAYFQFDLSQLKVAMDTQAVFRVVTAATAFAHRVQVWGLNEAYPGFTAAATWNSAQANDLASNSLLTSGPATATPIGASRLLSNVPSTPHEFTLSRLGDFVRGGRVTLALSAVDDAANSSGGLRLARNSASLSLLVMAEATNAPPSVNSIRYDENVGLTIVFSGTPAGTYAVQGNTNLASIAWIDLGTNVAGADGRWTFTDSASTNLPLRFYRAKEL